MKVKAIPSSWIRRQGLRLDCGPYMSGALEAKMALESLAARKEPLQTITKGHQGGIYNGPQFSRRWVDSPEHGVPFMGSSSMLLADLTNLPLLRKKDAYSAKLAHLRLEPGTTLISCSGTIGRMVYVRPDMDGMWSSQHIMKVVPDRSKILPGYLYAYLSSKFGVAQVVGGTYGAIIQHIEPEHIAHLPVPRYSTEFEGGVHKLVEAAASARSRAVELLRQARRDLHAQLSLVPAIPWHEYARPLYASVPHELLRARSDAFYYCPPNRDAARAFEISHTEASRELSEVADVFIPGIFKRLYADDPTFGYPYITGADVFQLAPASDRYLLQRVSEGNRLVLRKGMIVIQEAGQLGGLIGRSVYVGENLDGFACTNNMVRVTPIDPRDTGFIFAVLSSDYGVRLVSREAAGSSIPHLEEGRVRRLKVPWPVASL